MKKFAPKNVKVNCPGCPPRIQDIDTSHMHFNFTEPKRDDTKKVTIVDMSVHKQKFGDTQKKTLF